MTFPATSQRQGFCDTPRRSPGPALAGPRSFATTDRVARCYSTHATAPLLERELSGKIMFPGFEYTPTWGLQKVMSLPALSTTEREHPGPQDFLK